MNAEFSNAFGHSLSDLLEGHRLALRIAQRDVAGRYKGSSFGSLWALIHPLVMLAVYTVFFTQIFQAKWAGPSTSSSVGTYAMALFIGILTHGMLAESISRGATCISGNVTLVKKVVFPVGILPWSVALGAWFHYCIGIVLAALVWGVMGNGAHLGLLFWPLLWIPLLLLCFTSANVVAALNVYFPDTTQVVSVLATILLFTSPVFFSVESAHPALAVFIEINPLTYPMEQTRALLMFGQPMSWSHYLLYTTGMAALALLARLFFWKVRPGFADVL